MAIKRGLQKLLGPRLGAAGGEGGRTADLDREIRLPLAGIYVHWYFDGPVATMEWDVRILADPAGSVGIYLALAQGRIEGAAFYLGLQTDIWDPRSGRGIGKGLIFSTWWTFDTDATRLAPEGFRELGTHEGRFVGVRKSFPWTTGDYRVTLRRSEPAALQVPADWFDLSVEPTAPRGSGPGRPSVVGERTWIGGLAFPRRRASQPALFEASSTAFMEVYTGARRWRDVPRWDVDLMAYGDGCPSVRGTTEYPAFPFGKNRPMPNANARYDPTDGLVELRYGGGSDRVDPAGQWP